MEHCEFVIDCVQLLYYKCHKTIQVMVDHIYTFLIGTKNKKATINPINKKDNKCFQYEVIIALNHEELENILKE